MSDGGDYMYGHYVPTYEEYEEYVSTREPWETQVKYGHYTLYFCGVSLAAFALLRVFKLRIFQIRMRSGSQALLFKSQVFAFARLLTYPRLPFPVSRILYHLWSVGPLGPNILLFFALLFTSFYCWINKYYYRPPFYGSPPVALRSEWITVALLLFLFVLGAKRNLISWITGVSYDKLQVFHQGVAFIVVYMSLVHAMTEIIQSKTEMPWRETYESGTIWRTGFMALGPLLWLYFGSLPFVRRRLYEGFYLLHIAAAIMFIGFLYNHGFEILETNAYMNATIALFGFGFVTRTLMMLISNLLFRHRASISFDGHLVCVTIPTKLRWSPGMHFFIRFRHIRPFESHPFTIASIPSPLWDDKKALNDMLFVIQPENGFTLRLAEVATTASPDRKFPVILDGPYGEPGRNSLRAYDKVLLLAGGTGIAFVAPLLEDLAGAIKRGEGICKMVEVHWSVKRYDIVKIFQSMFIEAGRSAAAAGGSVAVHLYVTGDIERQRGSIDHSSLEKESKTSSPRDSNSFHFTMSTTFHRPNILEIIAERGRSWTGHIGVGACGPLAIVTDVSNAVSHVQVEILRGKATCQEMYLRTETFEW